MSATIQTQIALVHVDSGLPANSAVQRTSIGPNFTPLVVTVGTSEETVNLGDITTPKQVMLKLISGDAVRVGLDYGTDGIKYPFRLTDADEAMLLRLDTEGLVQIGIITAVADVGGSLDGGHFTGEGSSGTWAVWYDVDDNGTTEPAHGMDNSLEVTGVSTGDSAILVADATAAAMEASSAFLSDFSVAHTVGTDSITITDKHTGVRAAFSDVDLGFSDSVAQSGAASPVIHLKSLGSSQVLTAVAPH